MKTGLKVLVGFLTGAAAGAIIGLLYAPAPGKKTRKKIAREVKNVEHDLEVAAQKKLREAKGILSDKVDDLTESGKEVISSLKKNLVSS